MLPLSLSLGSRVHSPSLSTPSALSSFPTHYFLLPLHLSLAALGLVFMPTQRDTYNFARCRLALNISCCHALGKLQIAFVPFSAFWLFSIRTRSTSPTSPQDPVNWT